MLRPAPYVVLMVLALLAASARVARAEGVTVDVSIDVSEDGTRLILTHSRPVLYAIRATDKRIEIVYDEPVAARIPRPRVDGAILKRVVSRDDRMIALVTGDDFAHYESFELRNPFRLIVDLRGVKPITGERQEAAERPAPGTILVIDPGHGGVERGAIGPTGLEEREVTLDLARRLKQVLEQRDPPISVVLTRDEDRLVGLDERTAVANHNRADLFLSIHLNASPRVSASGAETYFLSTAATDDEARVLAALENRASGVEERSVAVVDGERRNLDLVLWDLAQNQHLAASSKLAESVQRHLNALTGTRDRGVRQAPFRVLMGATMPAILVEVGFVSNPQEEAKLRAPGYRAQVVDSIAAAVREFLEDLDRTSAPADGRPSDSP